MLNHFNCLCWTANPRCFLKTLLYDGGSSSALLLDQANMLTFYFLSFFILIYSTWNTAVWTKTLWKDEITHNTITHEPIKGIRPLTNRHINWMLQLYQHWKHYITLTLKSNIIFLLYKWFGLYKVFTLLHCEDTLTNLIKDNFVVVYLYVTDAPCVDVDWNQEYNVKWLDEL